MADNYYLSDYTGIVIDNSIGVGIQYDPATHEGYPNAKNGIVQWDTDVADKSWVSEQFISKDKEKDLGTVKSVTSFDNETIVLYDNNEQEINSITTEGYIGLKQLSECGQIGSSDISTGIEIEVPYILFDKYGRVIDKNETYPEEGSGTRKHRITGLAPIDSPHFTGIPTTPYADGSNETQIVNVKYVSDQIAAIPEPMIFKGTLGVGGTITELPTASKSHVGWTYKVITANTYQGQQAKVGDTFVSALIDGAHIWVLIPSGDEPSGTVTSVGLNKGSGIDITGTSNPITTSGTFTISHSDTSSATSVNITDVNKWINKISIDGFGHITEIGSSALDTSGTWSGTIGKNITFTNVIDGSNEPGVSFNGSKNIVVSCKTIGAALSKHTHLKSDITDFAHTHLKADITDFSHTHGNINYDGTITTTKNIDSSDSLIIIDSNNNIKKANLTFGTDENKFLSSTGEWKTVSVDNYYHTTGTWNGFKYTATAVGGAPELAFTLPVGTGSTQVAQGNHTHNYAGSNTPGGAALEAIHSETADSATITTKIDIEDTGNNSTFVYFKDGIPIASIYTIEKSVPSDAKFTDTTYENKTAKQDGADVSLVTTGEKYTWNNKYTKPSDGIPKSDLTASVQQSLAKADASGTSNINSLTLKVTGPLTIDDSSAITTSATRTFGINTTGVWEGKANTAGNADTVNNKTVGQDVPATAILCGWKPADASSEEYSVVTLKEKAQWNAGGVAPAQNFYHSTGSWDEKIYKATNGSELTPNLWIDFSHTKQNQVILKDDFTVDENGMLIINAEG